MLPKGRDGYGKAEVCIAVAEFGEGFSGGFRAGWVEGGRVLVALICLSATWISGAQTLSGQISGVVLDPAGRPVAGARVGLAPASDGRSEGTSDGYGEFSLPLPSAGIYELQVEAAGFGSDAAEDAA